MQLSGVQPAFTQLVGEGCNLTGSAEFNELVEAYERDEVMDVCDAQVE